MSTDPLSIGVVGLNYWGPNLARNFARLPGSRLTWCCDLDEELLDSHRPNFESAAFTTNLDDLLADPDLDGIAIATPVPTHAALAMKALEAGKHVFIEKPIALTAADARAVAELADKKNLIAMVDHLLVHHPAVTKVKEMTEAGELGQIYYLYGNRQNLGIVRPDENALWSLGPHDISVMLHLVGERPVEASASGESYLQPGIEDVVFGRVRFPSGVLGHLHLSWLDPHKMRKMTVIGADKMAVFDDMETERKVTVYDKGPVPRTDTYGEYIQVRSGDIHIPKIPGTEPLRLVTTHFIDCIRDGAQSLSDAWAGVAVVEVLEAMTESLANAGAPVAINQGSGGAS